MSERPAIGRWRNANAEQRYRAIEDELWNEFWPDPPASLDVDTHFGSTRAYQWPGTGTPVVFLHGATGISLAWTEYVEQVGGRPASTP
ncbi:MAG: hypothetical protein ACRDV7_09235 [Acidimicrobiia bacterium]